MDRVATVVDVLFLGKYRLLIFPRLYYLEGVVGAIKVVLSD